MLTVTKMRNHNRTIIIWKGGITVARRNLTATTRDGPAVIQMLVSGVPQGGVLGPEKMVRGGDEARDTIDGAIRNNRSTS